MCNPSSDHVISVLRHAHSRQWVAYRSIHSRRVSAWMKHGVHNWQCKHPFCQEPTMQTIDCQNLQKYWPDNPNLVDFKPPQLVLPISPQQQGWLSLMEPPQQQRLSLMRRMIHTSTPSSFIIRWLEESKSCSKDDVFFYKGDGSSGCGKKPVTAPPKTKPTKASKTKAPRRLRRLRFEEARKCIGSIKEEVK